MNEKHKAYLEDDFREVSRLTTRFLIWMKLLYYSLARPIENQRLKLFYSKHSIETRFLGIDLFLKDEGGMFKKFAYDLCDELAPLSESTILVPGSGYGKNLLQLASFGPKKIIAFDLYEYKEEWNYVQKLAKVNFGVDIVFYKGEFGVVPEEFIGKFDFIISDAVLEHVKDMARFMEYSRKYLRADGIFYASFGPIWFGPNGDHMEWQGGTSYEHLLMGEEEYKNKCNKELPIVDDDSCEAALLIREGLFSRLTVKEYIDIFKAEGFKKELLFAKISSKSILLRDDSVLQQSLDGKMIPKFDRYCVGVYYWGKVVK